jgi:hypothetical protein
MQAGCVGQQLAGVQLALRLPVDGPDNFRALLEGGAGWPLVGVSHRRGRGPETELVLVIAGDDEGGDLGEGGAGFAGDRQVGGGA